MAYTGPLTEAHDRMMESYCGDDSHKAYDPACGRCVNNYWSLMVSEGKLIRKDDDWVSSSRYEEAVAEVGRLRHQVDELMKEIRALRGLIRTSVTTTGSGTAGGGGGVSPSHDYATPTPRYVTPSDFHDRAPFTPLRERYPEIFKTPEPPREVPSVGDIRSLSDGRIQFFDGTGWTEFVGRKDLTSAESAAGTLADTLDEAISKHIRSLSTSSTKGDVL